MATQVCIFAFHIGLESKIEGGDGELRRLSEDYAYRMDAEMALNQFRDIYPNARVLEVKTQFELTDSIQLRAYQAYIARLFLTCNA